MINEIKRIKKVELHLHLDGSVSPLLASKLSGLSISECIKKMQVDNENQNLGEYLTKFDFPISLMQTEENLEIIAFDLVNRLEKENVIYYTLILCIPLPYLFSITYQYLMKYHISMTLLIVLFLFYNLL